MEYLQEFSVWLARCIKPHLVRVAIALVATVLFIYGAAINAAIKKQIQGYHFIIRVLIFILICAFGYGALTVAISVLVARLLARLDDVYLAPSILAFLIIVGILADRKKQI